MEEVGTDHYSRSSLDGGGGGGGGEEHCTIA